MTNNADLRNEINRRDMKIKEEQTAYRKVAQDLSELNDRKRKIEERYNKERDQYDKDATAAQTNYLSELRRLHDRIYELTKGNDEDGLQGHEHKATRKSSLASSISSKFKTFRRRKKQSKATKVDAE